MQRRPLCSAISGTPVFSAEMLSMLLQIGLFEVEMSG